MKIRSAKTLIFSREGGELLAFNFLRRSTFICSPDLLELLTIVDDWTDVADLPERIATISEAELTETISDLLEAGALVGYGSQLAEEECEFEGAWKWGLPAAAFHWSVQNKHYLSLHEGEALQLGKLEQGPQPALYLENGHRGETSYELPSALEGNDLLQLMARRRTTRAASRPTIALQQLSDCLFAGLGITGEVRTVAGSLPLSMTPSGGARNPYEAYVYARGVEGLEPGFYHYAAIDHTLARIGSATLPPPSELIGGQDWADSMPCLIILCAHLERTMWKYDDANAYRVVLIEAGHIGQNVMLAATRHGLSACPSAALNHSAINECLLSENRTTRAPVYALAIGTLQ